MNFVVFCLLIFSFSTFYLAHGNFCPDLTTAIEFQPSKMKGEWYSIGHSNKNYTDKVKCISVEFESETDTARVKWLGINKSDGKKDEVVGMIMSTNKPKVYREVLFKKTGSLSKPQDNNISIVSTDYKTYIIAYACDEDKKQYYSWVITKTRKIPFLLLEKMITILFRNKINIRTYNIVDQNSCSN